MQLTRTKSVNKNIFNIGFRARLLTFSTYTNMLFHTAKLNCFGSYRDKIFYNLSIVLKQVNQEDKK